MTRVVGLESVAAVSGYGEIYFKSFFMERSEGGEGQSQGKYSPGSGWRADGGQKGKFLRPFGDARFLVCLG